MANSLYTMHLQGIMIAVFIKTNIQSFKPHVAIMLKKANAVIAALRRIKCLVPSDVMISLYKAFMLPHIEYCCQLLLGISKSLKKYH